MCWRCGALGGVFEVWTLDGCVRGMELLMGVLEAWNS